MDEIVEIKLSRVFVDLVVFVLCAIPLIILNMLANPYKRGFYCDDETIRYPYKDSTVSTPLVIVLGLLAAVIAIVACEAFRVRIWEKSCKDQFNKYKCRRFVVNRFFVRLYVFLGYFFIGAVFNQLMVDIAKKTIGRQRPHFIAVCQPEDSETCNPISHTYITDFNCKGKNAYRITDSMLSFYSGHAAFSFYVAWFISLYLQARLYKPLFSHLMLPAIQFALHCLAAFVAYTRVSDYKHHWSDVLVGAFAGSVIGIVVALFFAEVFHRREIPLCDKVHIAVPFGVAVNKRAPMADVESGLRLEEHGIQAF